MLEQQFWVKAVHDISRYESKDQTFQAKGPVHTWYSSPDFSIILIHTQMLKDTPHYSNPCDNSHQSWFSLDFCPTLI